LQDEGKFWVSSSPGVKPLEHEVKNGGALNSLPIPNRNMTIGDIKNTVFWDMMLCGSVRTDVSEESITSIIKVKRIIELGMILIFLRDVFQLLVKANAIPNSLILVTLMMEEILSSEMSALARATLRHIQEDGILQSSCRENLNS
jgi:hypothetical protein